MATQAEKEKLDLENVLSTDSGRRVLTRLLDQCGIDESGVSRNELKMAQLTGKREVGLWLQRELIQASQEHYLILIKEKITNGN